jgi:hypothetical protein
MNRTQYIKHILSSLHVRSIKECTSIYHIAENLAKKYDKQNKHVPAKIEWFFSEQLRRITMIKINNYDAAHMKAIQYCRYKQKINV